MTKFALLGGASALALAATTAVQAADLPYRSAAPLGAAPVFTTYDWTGAYAGINAGYRAANFDPTVNSLEIPGKTGHSATIGGHVGYNMQVAPNIVVGGEGDLSYGHSRSRGPGALNSSSSAAPNAPVTGQTTVTTATTALATRADLGLTGSIRGRLGYAYDRWMVYGTGGLALADLLLQGASTGSTTQGVFAGSTLLSSATAAMPTFIGRQDKVAVGYTVGAGVEFALTPNVLLRAEYLYADYGRHTVTIPTGATSSVDVDTHSARGGISYKF